MMNLAEQRFPNLDIPRDLDEIVRFLAHAHDAPLPAELRHRVSELLAETRKVVQPCGVYTVRDVVSVREGHLALEGCPAFRGSITGFLQAARRVAVFVVTIGGELEEMIDARVASGDRTDVCILDAIGSVAVESAADALADRVLWDEAGNDEVVTPPFSPGSCGIAVEEQLPVFSILNVRAIGVRLTPDMKTRPRKSVSGILGIGDHEAMLDYTVPCQWCEQEECRMCRPRRRA